MNPLGPFFKCNQELFLGGLDDLSNDQTSIYVRLILRMYADADACFASPKQIARWSKSNARKVQRVLLELMRMGKLKPVPHPNNPSKIGYINLKSLAVMLENCQDAKVTGRFIPETVIERLSELSRMFPETFAYVSQSYTRKPNKNKGPYKRKEIRNKIRGNDVLGGVVTAVPEDGTAARKLFDVITQHHGMAVWKTWFVKNGTIEGSALTPHTALAQSKYQQIYWQWISAAGLTIQPVGRRPIDGKGIDSKGVA